MVPLFQPGLLWPGAATCFVVTEYGKLTKKAKKFLKIAEDEIGSPITLISTGPEMTQIIDLRNELI